LPDFSFEHVDGRKILPEIVGLWTPEHIEAKYRVIQEFRSESLLLAVLSDQVGTFRDLARDVIIFQTSLKIEIVLNTLRQLPVSSTRTVI